MQSSHKNGIKKKEEENKLHLFLYVTHCPNYHFTISANQVFLDESDTDAMAKFVCCLFSCENNGM